MILPLENMSLPRDLPICDVLPELRLALLQRDSAILVAPPGAGKTTLVPLYLLQNLDDLDGKILVLEPRRLAARAAAERMAELLHEKVGETVGYRIRFESRVSDATRIEVVTAGIALRMLQNDPELSGVGLVILDEFHERSMDFDLSLALLLQVREWFREPDQGLKILPMSATLAVDSLQQLLPGAQCVESLGRSFPVATQYGKAWHRDEDLEARVCAAVLKLCADQTGSILVFLPGQREIQRVAGLLRERLGDSDEVAICPLYGDLSLQQQRSAIRHVEGVRKIVLATSIAETSVTIEGITVVVDSGLSRLACFDPRTGMSRLQTVRVSRAAATQRCGRAGRLREGLCLRMWSETQQQQLVEYHPAEILAADLAPLLLQLWAWGIYEVSELRWLDAPPAAAVAQASDLLLQLGAAEVHDKGLRITGHGEAMASLPAHPRLAHMMRMGQAMAYPGLACELAALLGERDPAIAGIDIHTRLAWLRGEYRSGERDQGLLHRLRRQVRQFESLLESAPATAPDLEEHEAVGVLIAHAYPDRIAQASGDRGRFRMANGRRVKVSDSEALHARDCIAVAAVGGRQGQTEDRVYLAAEISTALLHEHFAYLIVNSNLVQWSEREERLLAVSRKCLGALVLEEKALSKIPDAERTRVLCDVIRRQGLEWLPWTDRQRQFLARIRLMHDSQGAGESVWPDVSGEALLDSLELWLGPFLCTVSTRADLRRIDLEGALKSFLPWDLQALLDKELPQRMRVPSGSELAIDYCQSPPVLAVKLQEMFACEETPSLAGGRVALSVHLLSPARRPLAVTMDLASFWRNAYPQVRKEFRGRYPKHPWPEDPLTAPPTARTKPRK